MNPSRFLLILTIATTLLSFNLVAQYPGNPLPQHPKEWNSRWVSHPDIDPTAYGCIHFRKVFDLDEQPKQFVVHVSGDNRYRLFVNGKEVCYGPQLSDIRHWRYETLDLGPYLLKGKNVIAAEVMNWGIDRAYGIISLKTGFLLQGHSDNEYFINTSGNNDWKVLRNEGIHKKTVQWMNGKDIVGGFYASNPTDSIFAESYPWGWKNVDYDDSNWTNPLEYFEKPETGEGHGWILQARTTAIQSSKKEAFHEIIRTDIKDLPKDYRFGSRKLTIPANSTKKMLVDQGYVTIGYPKLHLSGGRDTKIRVQYAEALYDENLKKGNRNETKGKVIKGLSDVYIMDGGENRTFQPMWFRAFRFIQLEIQTAEEPLVINDFYNVYSASDFNTKARFKCSDPDYQQVWDICWHTLKICAQDNFISDAYYEQMQYVGDLRPHLMNWTALTGDFSYFHSAMEQFNNSRLPDGNITSCYPLKSTFVIPPYSLIWIDMLHDLMMKEGDKSKIQPYLGEIQEVFDYYESIVNENGLVGESKYHMFIDWYLPKGGNSTVNKKGNSAILTLNYAYTLRKAADIADWLNEHELALVYRNLSTRYSQRVRQLCFNEQKGIYADDPEQTYYDQRASILAVLCNAHSQEESKVLMGKILDANTRFDSKANLFYYFYLFEAMEKTGVGDFTQVLEPWRKMVELGMSGTPEKRMEQHPRSEIHPWTAHPVHFYFSLVAGIKPASPGFKTVIIEPNPGELSYMQASYPTILGDIVVDLNFEQNENVAGDITLPEGITGVFKWHGKEVNLKAGRTEIDF